MKEGSDWKKKIMHVGSTEEEQRRIIEIARWVSQHRVKIQQTSLRPGISKHMSVRTNNYAFAGAHRAFIGYQAHAACTENLDI